MRSLYQDVKTLELFIGPDIETGKGLWTSSMADGEPDVQTSF